MFGGGLALGYGLVEGDEGGVVVSLRLLVCFGLFGFGWAGEPGVGLVC